MLSLDATIIYRIPALLMALTVHEYAHGAMSTHLGDPTPGAQGRPYDESFGPFGYHRNLGPASCRFWLGQTCHGRLKILSAPPT